MEENRKWIYIFLVFFVAISISAITPAVISNQQSFDPRSGAEEGLGLDDGNVVGVPRVVSIDPSSAYVGDEFNYYLKIVDSDTEIEDIDVKLLSAPEWISFDEESLRVYGEPEIDISDTAKIELLIDDGKNSIVHKFYLLILERDDETD